MKKILGVFCAVLLTLSMSACGGEKSTKEQEKTVTDFFSYIEKGDLDSIKNITTEDGYRVVKAFQSQIDAGISEFNDTTNYGEATNNAAKDYIDYTFSKVYKDVKIEEIEPGDKDTVIKVKGQFLDSEELITKMSEIDFDKNTTDFINNEENKAKMQEIYNTQGENEVVKWVLDQIAPALINDAKALVDGCSYKSFDGTFRLILEDDKWLIDTIS